MDEAFADPSGLAAILDDMAFTADCGLQTADCGLRTADCGLRVTFGRAVVGAAPAGSFVVTLSRATVTRWLSAFGKRAQQQTIRPSGPLDLGAAATPTPAVPTHMGSGDPRPLQCTCREGRTTADGLSGWRWQSWGAYPGGGQAGKSHHASSSITYSRTGARSGGSSPRACVRPKSRAGVLVVGEHVLL